MTRFLAHLAAALAARHVPARRFAARPTGLVTLVRRPPLYDWETAA